MEGTPPRRGLVRVPNHQIRFRSQHHIQLVRNRDLEEPNVT